MKAFDVNTKLVGLLGHPLKQTFSPAMQNSAFRAAGLDYFYLPMEVEAQNLEAVLNGLRRLNFAGFNITKPNKIEVLQYLDEIDPAAKAIGAVNTVKITDGKLVGYNTDGLGFAAFLEQDMKVSIAGSSLFVLGAGGAGRAIVTVLALRGAKDIVVTDIYEDAGISLVEAVNALVPGGARFVSFDSNAMKDEVVGANVVINATAVGMNPYEALSPLDAILLDKSQLICDIIYNPPITKLMREAKALGCRVANGLGMVIYQGAAAFTIWTGQEAPIDVMSATVHELASKK